MVETEVVVSLDDERSKYISEVLGNKSCKKILGYLSENEACVSDISKELKIPINTADYNIKKLIKAGLIEKSDFWWSVKGKKMPTYRVSNKKIIISPKSFKSYSRYLFALIASGIAALVIRSMGFGKQMTQAPVETILENGGTFASDASEQIVTTAQDVAEKSTSLVVERSSDLVAGGSNVAFSAYMGVEVWLWFLLGAWSMIVIFFVFNLFVEGKFFSPAKEDYKKSRKKNVGEYEVFSKKSEKKKVKKKGKQNE
jgi:DNA-binding transcriptional ArsR family regulator